MRFLFTGGGTGGHVYPALAIAKCLKIRNEAHEILFVGTKRGMESDIVPKEGFDFCTITVEGMPRKLSMQMLKTGIKLCQGLWQAKKIIADFKPDVVVATGGYVSAPIALLASWKGIPVMVHEQNAFPGVTNRLVGKWATKIALTYPGTEEYFVKEKCLVTGNPVRPEILAAQKDIAIESMGLDKSKKTLLIFGGSRGARSINQSLKKIAVDLKKENDWQIIHVTGKNDFPAISGANEGEEEKIDGNIIYRPYLYDMPNALASSDLVVCRSGATTLAELTSRGLPSILIPYPYATDNHQEYNARTLEKAEAASVLLDKELDRLPDVLFPLMHDEAKLKEMSENCKSLGKSDAAAVIAGIVEKM